MCANPGAQGVLSTLPCPPGSRAEQALGNLPATQGFLLCPSLVKAKVGWRRARTGGGRSLSRVAGKAPAGPRLPSLTFPSPPVRPLTGMAVFGAEPGLGRKGAHRLGSPGLLPPSQIVCPPRPHAHPRVLAVAVSSWEEKREGALEGSRPQLPGMRTERSAARRRGRAPYGAAPGPFHPCSPGASPHTLPPSLRLGVPSQGSSAPRAPAGTHP